MLWYFICYHTFRKINALIVLIMTHIANTDIPLERKRIFSSQSQLTCPLHGILNGSVTDSCVTWLDVHERFASNSHRHHLQHAQLYNPNTKICVLYDVFKSLCQSAQSVTETDLCF